MIASDNKVWDDAAHAELRELCLVEPPLSLAEIGRRLGCSKNAIVGKRNRLNLPPRPSPIAGNGNTRPRAPRQPVHRAVTLQRLVSLAAPVVKAAPTPPPQRPMGKVRCAWLDGQRWNYVRCEAMTMQDSVYCHAHSCRAYRRLMVAA